MTDSLLRISPYGLFLGFPIDTSFSLSLKKVSPEIRSLFIQEDYLQEICYKNVSYLGKQIGQKTDLTALDLTQNHILSLLRKLVPNYPYDTKNLLLFVINNQEK